MLDRVRESVFGVLGASVEGARVLDLYAGTGSLGLEALSRGAVEAVFVERDPEAAAVIEANVAKVKAGDRAAVVTDGAGRYLGLASPCDLLFFDPPYARLEDADEREETLDLLLRYVEDVVQPGGHAVFHAPRDLLAVEDLVGLPFAEPRDWGTSTVFFVSKGA